jgi:hypothetical protein
LYKCYSVQAAVVRDCCDGCLSTCIGKLASGAERSNLCKRAQRAQHDSALHEMYHLTDTTVSNQLPCPRYLSCLLPFQMVQLSSGSFGLVAPFASSKDAPAPSSRVISLYGGKDTFWLAEHEVSLPNNT